MLQKALSAATGTHSKILHLSHQLPKPVWLEVCLRRWWDLHQWKLRNIWAIISVLLLLTVRLEGKSEPPLLQFKFALLD